jgi:hypothetical protein
MAVIFPKIEKLTLHGFSKIFVKNDFEINFFNNLSILLGGNGLGKTTLLQCIVYALTGGTDDNEVEEVRTFRWNHNFFKGRVNDDAYIYIDFFLGENRIRIKRGFSTTRVLECFLLTDQQNIKAIVFEQAIIEYGNYSSVSDFSFIVNRLLYLPENRRSLLWDYDAQIRILMIISNEFVVEQEYRSLRQLVKLKDSNKRKLGWDIRRIDKRNVIQEAKKVVDITNEIFNKTHHSYIENKKDILNRLQKLADESKLLYGNIKSDQEARNSLAQSILSIGDEIRIAEADYMQELLLEHDEKNALVFNKTIKTGYCPACDQKSDNLKKLVQERIIAGVCLICGEPISKHISTSEELDLDSLNSQLYEKISARNELDFRITQNNNKLTALEEDIQTFRNQLSELDSSYSEELLDDNDDDDEIIDFKDENLIAEEYLNICQKEKDLELEIIQITKQADELYNTFISNFQIRYEQLHEIYGDLASKFLGLPVELKYTKSNAKFVNMNFLVPNFGDIDRDSPETCSEAQRFFLDIAFRMSVITLNKAINNIDATFICETPENALDISYIDNVVKMFVSFMQKGGNLLLTNNLQYYGIAQNLIRETREQKIKVNVFDLLQYGKLSEIQNSSAQLISIRDAIVKEADR